MMTKAVMQKLPSHVYDQMMCNMNVTSFRMSLFKPYKKSEIRRVLRRVNQLLGIQDGSKSYLSLLLLSGIDCENRLVDDIRFAQLQTHQ